ncbi:C40 family peptidase [Mangrovihabitans endophyticus]|uniref:C40 family peptidase n=1 Tax=Mangrovihabitans endophyticus TaxID=1751298 RepID=UPI00166D33AA
MVVTALAVAISGGTATAAHAEPSSSDITKKIDKASDNLEDITESYNKLKISLKKTISDEKELAASLEPAKKALQAASADVQTMAQTAYMTGQVGTMNMILDGPGNLVDKMSVLDQMSRKRQRQIAQYTATTETFTERQKALQTTQKKQAAEVEELAARKDKIESDLKNLYAMRKAAYGREREKTTSYSGPVPSVSGSAGAAVRYAYGAIGKPYVYGASGPGSYDCSGLTAAAWAAAGKSLPHNAAAQWSAVSHVSKSALAPGDLVFYRGLGHVGIYVGGGQVIDAPHAGTTVKKRSMYIMTPYGYGRP